MDVIQTLQHTFWLYLVWVAVIALCVGSFLNVVIYRLPLMMQHDETLYCETLLKLPQKTAKKPFNLSWPLSHCAHCQHTLKPWHNIPLLSFLCLRGRCAYCKKSIALRYPAVELLTCLSALLIAFHFGMSLNAVFGFLFIACGIPMIFIDLDHQLLPDQLTLLLLWLGLFASLLNVTVTPSVAIIGSIAGYAVFWIFAFLFKLIAGKEGLGQGDFKLLAALGAWMGFNALPMIIFLSALFGILAALFYKLITHKNLRGLPIPFGPCLILAGFIALLWGSALSEFYLNLTGLT